MPTVTKVRVRGLKSKYRVTLYAREGSYALSVPNSRLGQLLLPIARQHPITINVKPPVTLSELPRGVKPVRKTAPKTFTYVPLSKRKKKSKSKKGKSEQKHAATVAAVATPQNKSKRNRSTTTSQNKSKRSQKAALVA